MIGKVFDRATVAFVAGYVLGARAGRERYEQIMRWWDGLTGTPGMRWVTDHGRELAERGAHRAQEAIAERIPAARGFLGADGGGNGSARRASARVGDVMTATVETARRSESVSEAARKMKEQDVGALVVIDETQAVCGIVTDRDIAIRAVAEGAGSTALVGDIVSTDIVTLAPDDTLDAALRTMRERSVRRLPVVVDGRPVGIVSLGDLAIEREPSSVLAAVSSAPAND
jgi:CBS domain-containing protein